MYYGWAVLPVAGWLVQSHGWRSAWMSIGTRLPIVPAPLGWLIVRRSPESVGLAPDGTASTTSHPLAVVAVASLTVRLPERRA